MKIGATEIIIILIVALIAIGPEKLPEYARKFGEALSQFKQVSNAATKEIRENVVEPLEEAQRPLKEAMEPIEELNDTIKKNTDEIQSSLNGIGRKKPKKKADAAAAAASSTEDVKADVAAGPVPEAAAAAVIAGPEEGSGETQQAPPETASETMEPVQESAPADETESTVFTEPSAAEPAGDADPTANRQEQAGSAPEQEDALTAKAEDAAEQTA